MSEKNPSSIGKVWLVGAGPGDPDLLTVKALRLLQTCDVVIYDRLVSPAIMELIPVATRKIYVGKARSEHAVPQDNINQLLVDEARAGHKVLRLKGGDPFIFGRGGEELELLAEANVAFEVIPGITAASGCAAYAGIPLTHRDYAQSVRFITGHLKNDEVNLRWPELMDPMQTLVFYMGLVGLQAICEQLIQHGRDPQTPVALIEKGTTPQQRVVIAALATINERVHAEQVTAPTLTIIGDVVKLHEKLKWR
jgi:uroporphyrin-III C-methyltransferase/precorrin-2 dehydrogenase/sirohydrochlorin ferrochelatase